MQTELTISTLEPALRWLNMAGLSVFAVSGALAAARQRLDIIRPASSPSSQPSAAERCGTS
jgi:hypothetical protein